MPLPSPTNPIAYAQFHLSGGWKTNGIVSGAVVLVLAMLIYATQRDHGVGQPSAVAGWALGMQMIQLLILLIYGSFRVEAAVRADVTSRMIDSHRLMPSSAVGAVLSYILVAPVTAISLALAMVLTGLGCCLVGGADAWTYLSGSGLIFAFSFFVWTMVARFAFDSRGGFLLALLVGAVMVVSQGALIGFVPAVSVLVCPVLGNPVFVFMGRGSVPLTEYSISVAGQMAVVVLFVIAAARRYRSDEAIGFSTLLGLVMLGLWVGLSIIGMDPELTFFHARFFSGFENGYTPERFVASMAAAMVLAAMPLSAAARQSARWVRRGPTPSLPTKPASVWVAGFGAVAVISVLLLLPGTDGTKAHHTLTAAKGGLTIATLVVYVVAVSCLFEWFYLAAEKAVVLTIAWFVLTWVLPAILAGIASATGDFDRLASMLLCASPVGLLARIWTGDRDGQIVGLAVQAVSTALPVTLLVTRYGRVKQRPAQGFPVLAAA